MASQRLSEIERSAPSTPTHSYNPSAVLNGMSSLWSENLFDNGKVTSAQERQKAIDQHRTRALQAIQASENGTFFHISKLPIFL